MLFAMPRSSSSFRIGPTVSSFSTMPSGSVSMPVAPSDSAQMGEDVIRVELNQTQNGFRSLLALSCSRARRRGTRRRRFHPFLGERAGVVDVCLPRPKRGSSAGVSVSVASHLSTPRGPKSWRSR